MKQTPKPSDPNKPRNLSEIQFKYSAPSTKGFFAYHQIQAIAPEATRSEDLVTPTGKIINRGGKGQVVGTIQWHPRSGDVNWVRTHQDYRGLGIATTLWEKATKLSADAGIKAPQHSRHRTDEGNAWAKSVGGKMPRRAPYEEW